MTEEFNFLKEIEEELDKQFPKGECKERGNALVLFAMVNIKFEEFIKKLDNYESSGNELLGIKTDVVPKSFIKVLAGEKLK